MLAQVTNPVLTNDHGDMRDIHGRHYDVACRRQSGADQVGSAA